MAPPSSSSNDIGNTAAPPAEAARRCVLTGFVRIEESDGRVAMRKSGPAHLSQSEAPEVTPAKARARARVCSRWLYGVLKGDRLRLYWRRTDYKRRAPPLDELTLQMKAGERDESVFGFDHECVYVRAKDSGRVLSVRIHQKKDIVRWVTALYYQSLGHGHRDEGGKDLARGRSASPTSSSAGSEGSTGDNANANVDTRGKRKSVSFREEPQVVVLPRQSYDPDDLFYSSVDYEMFLQQRKSHLSSLMQAIYAKTAAKLKVSSKKHLR